MRTRSMNRLVAVTAAGALALTGCASSSNSGSCSSGGFAAVPAAARHSSSRPTCRCRARPRTTSDATNKMIQLYLDQIGNKAGNYTVKLKTYDDSTAAKGAWDDAPCAKNAKEHVANADEVAVMGTYNSGCAKIEVPILNQDSDRADADGVAREHQPRSDQDLGPGRAGQVLPDRQAQLRPCRHHRRLPGRGGRRLRRAGPEAQEVLRPQRQPDLRHGCRQGVRGRGGEGRHQGPRQRARGTRSRPTTPRCSRRSRPPNPTASTSAASTTTTVASWSRTRSRSSATTPVPSS